MFLFVVEQDLLDGVSDFLPVICFDLRKTDSADKSVGVAIKEPSHL